MALRRADPIRESPSEGTMNITAADGIRYHVDTEAQLLRLLFALRTLQALAA